MRPEIIERDLIERLADLAVLADVPGATAAMLLDGQVHQAAFGVLSVDTRVPATTDAVFQIGSITKMLTATLIMQLVQDGLLELDRPVRSYLAAFEVADPDASASITPRQLLAHMSGIEGDRFLETGEGPEAVAAYLERCRDLPQLHAPGAAVSYCNFGYAVLGRLLEVITGQPFDEILQTRIARPLGADRLLTRLDEVVKHRVAVGHVPSADGRPIVVAKTYLPRSMSPAGATAVCSVGDLIRVLRPHLREGPSSGPSLLDASLVEAMQRVEGSLPGSQWVLPHRGLGWVVAEWSGERIVGHDGGTTGQASFFRAAPNRGFALALLTNGLTRPKLLFDGLFRGLFADYAALSMPEAPATITLPPEALAALPATYASERTRIDVLADGSELWMRDYRDGSSATTETSLAPVAPRTFKILTPGLPTPDAAVFHTDDSAGRPQLLLIRNRNLRRVA